MRAGALAIAALTLGERPANAVETTFSTYVLGFRTVGAGLTPPAGLYLNSNFLFYNGKYVDPVPTPAGPVQGTVHADLAIDIAEVEWVTPYTIAGGTPAFVLVVPFGFLGVDRTVGTSFDSDADTTIGDPNFEAYLGWHRDQLHWKIGAVYNAPIGDYEPGRLSNLSFNRSAVDLYGALTWLAPSRFEVSVDGGLIINGENTITNYQSGNEIYGEFAIGRRLTREISAGMLGYQYLQLNPDSNADVGFPPNYRGRATALGGYIAGKFHFEHTTVETKLIVMRQFDVRDRFRGIPVILKFAITDDDWRR